MGEAVVAGLDGLPHHLLQKILQTGDLLAADLASMEMSCYTFKAAGGLEPYRFKSMTENAAFQYCHSDPLFVRLSSSLQSQLLGRCRGNWKLVLRFLQATHQAASGVSVPSGKVQVVAGKYLSFLINGQGKLFGCGSNQFGVLGQGQEVVDCTVPVEIVVPTGLRVAQVSGTHHHVSFVTENGNVFTYGDNSSGCCGHGDIEGPIHIPTLVETLREFPCKQVSTGLSFMGALTKDGEVYSWGAASHGQLGHGDTVEHSRPVRVESLTAVGPVSQIATGASYTLAVMTNGELYSFGYGANNCLGHDELVSEWQPRQVVLPANCFISSVAAGDEHCVAIDSLGQVYTWGKGYCGALGHGNEDDVGSPRILRGLPDDVLAVQVSARRRKTFVLTDTGDLFAFGWMAFGSLGLTNTLDKVMEPHKVPQNHFAQVSAGSYHTVGLSREGLFIPFGDDEKGQLNLVSGWPSYLRENSL